MAATNGGVENTQTNVRTPKNYSKEYEISEKHTVSQGEISKNYKGKNWYDNSYFNTLSSNIFKQEFDDNLFTTGEGGVKLPQDQVRSSSENISMNLTELGEKGLDEYMNTQIETGLDLSYSPIVEITDYRTGEKREYNQGGVGRKGGFGHLINVLDKARGDFNERTLFAHGTDMMSDPAKGIYDESGGNVTLEDFEAIDIGNVFESKEKDFDSPRTYNMAKMAEKLPYIRAIQQDKQNIINQYFGGDMVPGAGRSWHIENPEVARQKFQEIVEQQELKPGDVGYRKLMGEFLNLADTAFSKTQENLSSFRPDILESIANQIFEGNGNAAMHVWKQNYTDTYKKKKKEQKKEIEGGVTEGPQDE